MNEKQFLRTLLQEKKRNGRYQILFLYYKDEIKKLQEKGYTTITIKEHLESDLNTKIDAKSFYRIISKNKDMLSQIAPETKNENSNGEKEPTLREKLEAYHQKQEEERKNPPKRERKFF